MTLNITRRGHVAFYTVCFLEVIDHLLLTFGKLDIGHSVDRNMGLEAKGACRPDDIDNNTDTNGCVNSVLWNINR